jgi:hypothetical protein
LKTNVLVVVCVVYLDDDTCKPFFLTRRRRRIPSSLLEDERKRAGAPSSIDREGGIKWSNSEGEFREKTREKDTRRI